MAFPPQNLAWLPQWYGSCETAKGCCLTWVLKMDGSLPRFTASCVNCLCHSPTLCHHPPSESEQDAEVTLAAQFAPHFSEPITIYKISFQVWNGTERWTHTCWSITAFWRNTALSAELFHL
jgi:hypothetical protein